MKIRFDSLKEKRPTQDNGVEVLYAPSKRLAFRARWYFILFLVLLPVAFLVFTYGASLIRIEAPALVRLPMAEIRARQRRNHRCHSRPSRRSRGCWRDGRTAG